MIILGLAGKAGSGKDTVAAYLQERYGFIPFSFSDALYKEVATAFGLENEDLLRDRATKEGPSKLLTLDRCHDREFVRVADALLRAQSPLAWIPDVKTTPRSPRWVLQNWGTAYRRAQDPDYWIGKADEFIQQMTSFGPYAELRPQNFVNTSVRFPNERDWIHYLAPGHGSVWHIHRDTAMPVASHESETPLPVLEGERGIWNNYTLEYLHMGVDQLMSSNIPSIRVEPPEPMVAP